MIDRSSSEDEIRWAVLEAARRGNWAGWADARLEWHRRLAAQRREVFELTDRDIDYVGEEEQWRIEQAMGSCTRHPANSGQDPLPF